MKRPNRGGLEVRCRILVEYAKWTARAAINSKCPIKRTDEVYQLLDGVGFAEVFSGELDFNTWHERETRALCKRAAKLRPDVAPFPIGWSAKLINVFLKTVVYAGGLGSDELRGALHPPLDAGLQQGLRRRFRKREYPEIHGRVTFGAIKDITTYKKYRTVIEGCRTAAGELGCSLIEVEQFGGLGLREDEDPPGRLVSKICGAETRERVAAPGGS